MLFIYSLAIYVSKEVIVTGSVELENVTHYVQIVYWLEVWLLATVAFDTPRRRSFALTCILVAALMSSASIFHGYLIGTRLTYGYQQIAASTGLFNTGKGIAGVLVVSGIASAYLLRDRAGSAGAFAACLMFAGAFLTYARAGLVALVAGLFTILAWAFVICRDATTARWARRLLTGCLLAGAIGYVAVGTADLTTRWADITDSDQAGSGRITFWKVALSSFWNADFSEQMLGRGYVRMCTAIQSGYGMQIHTHSDFLDMLLVGGVLGVVCLLVFWVALLTRLRLLNVASAEYGAGLAILAGFFAQSTLTGQIFDPSTMSVYVIAFVCVTAIDSEEDIDDFYTYRYTWQTS
jgi:O-antigen ligase